MSSENRKDKYCLKGEFYEALEIVNMNLGGVVPNSFRKEVYSDLIDVFYRNQSDNKSFSDAMGCSLDDFIADIVDTYYSTLGGGEYINNLFQNAFLLSLLCEIFYIVNSLVVGESGALSFATIIIGTIGFISGLICFYCNYKIVYKLKGWNRRLFKTFLILAPLYVVILFQDSIYNLTKHILISKKLVLGIIILEAIIYIVLIFRNRFKKIKNIG